MARSTKIYVVVTDYGHEGEDAEAAFTVKHEMVTWLGQQKEWKLESMKVRSFEDGLNRVADKDGVLLGTAEEILANG